MIIKKIALHVFAGTGKTKEEACNNANENANSFDNCETQHFKSFDEALEASGKSSIGGAVKGLTKWEAFAAEIVEEQWETDKEGELKNFLGDKTLKWIEAK